MIYNWSENNREPRDTMTDPLYDLYFSGQLIEDQELAQVRLKVGKIFGADEAMLDRLFSGKPVRIKAGVHQDSAVKYRVAFRDAGALVEIRPAGGESQTQTTPKRAQADGDNLALLPPNTGSLIDCAPKVPAAIIPDISDLVLDPAGTAIDTSSPPPPSPIDTGSLTVAPAHSGTLEDCQIPVQPAVIGDISNLHLKEDGSTA